MVIGLDQLSRRLLFHFNLTNNPIDVPNFPSPIERYRPTRPRLQPNQVNDLFHSPDPEFLARRVSRVGLSACLDNVFGYKQSNQHKRKKNVEIQNRSSIIDINVFSAL